MSIPLWAIIAGLVVSALGVGASVYGQHQANQTNISLNRENNELQQQLAGQANQWSLDRWDAENDYNNPIAQRARLAGANLNPSLIYGQGGLMNEAAASPQPTMANTRSTQVQNPLANLGNADPLTMAQIANLDAQTEETKSRIPVNKAHANQIEKDAERLGNLARREGVEADFAEKTLAQRISTQLAEGKLKESEALENQKYVEDNIRNQYLAYQSAAEKARNEKLISDEQYKIVQEELKQAIAATEIAQYKEKMKELDYWWEKGDDLLRHAENIFGLFMRFKMPMPQGITITESETYDANGNPTGSRSTSTTRL